MAGLGELFEVLVSSCNNLYSPKACIHNVPYFPTYSTFQGVGHVFEVVLSICNNLDSPKLHSVLYLTAHSEFCFA